jgi:4-hydroxy-3-methylbut-2-en-1-yl diphosphate synthase IspG/GcpE
MRMNPGNIGVGDKRGGKFEMVIENAITHYIQVIIGVALISTFQKS